MSYEELIDRGEKASQRGNGELAKELLARAKEEKEIKETADNQQILTSRK